MLKPKNTKTRVDSFHKETDATTPVRFRLDLELMAKVTEKLLALLMASDNGPEHLDLHIVSVIKSMLKLQGLKLVILQL